MNKSAKEIAYVGITVALLIGSQLALSAVSGIEVVTAIFALYCFVFGVIRGITVATTFSIVRCLAFGFFPQVLLLYLIYYNLFAVVIGLFGKVLKDSKVWLKIVCLTALACLLTVCFTMLDNLLNVLLFSLSSTAASIYIAQSIPTMITQVICVAVTLPTLFYPLYKAFVSVKNTLPTNVKE